MAAAFAITPLRAPASEAPETEAPRIVGLRHVEGRTRVALRLARASGFEVFALEDPPRLVVAFDGPAWEGAPPPPPPGGLVKAVRAGLVADGRARLVLELVRPARLAEAVQFPDPDDPSGPTILRLELAYAAPDAFAAAVGWPEGQGPLAPAPPPADPRPLVMIDPGHGGMDPGAIRGEAVEKALVMTFARDLKAALEATGRWRVALTREDDRYLGLAERVARAEAAGAAALLSIHANTVARGDAVGASIFTLAAAGSTDAETAALADSENRADVAPGDDRAVEPDAALRAVHEIGMRRALLASRGLGTELVDHLAQATPMLRGRAHSQAGFRVLKSSRVPAALVELGFLSNAQDLARMRDPAWRRRAAQALTQGLDAWAGAAAARPFAALAP
ncbi:N-acetylmuramoyl-L-alanine amidase [Albimonas pacifica]|uniref:N-acetylmuramoyl-L-alanine amidase n=1 Tax=Albimonas pacifica TaxID=1114924 RepID=UPI0015A6EA63|nr:N-acetylmuramoyl-L-alanine amidase [Albimonas pacifica]